jgi:pimeloyl-ACP methyl ester carboxylesterase
MKSNLASRLPLLSGFSLAVLLVTQVAWTAEYQFPINDPWLATVVGTPEPLRADLPAKIPLKIRRLPKIAGREMPEAMWYAQRLEYSYRLQSGSAPMIFLLAGTGGYHNTGKNLLLLKAFYQAGFHVVGITSPTHTQFVIAASGTSVPGHLEKDAEDIYRVMQQIRDEIGHSDRITAYHLAGYSLGGTHAAFLAKLDAAEKKIGFEKVLMINPSVSLYNSISMLDRMLQNVPGGMDNFHLVFENVVHRISTAYQKSSTVEFSPELVFEAFKDSPPTNEELAALIGVAFRLSSSGLIFASDLMTDYGFIKPANVSLTRNSSLGMFGAVAVRVGFSDYYHEFFWPYYQPDYPDDSRYSFAQRHTLNAIRTYLEGAQNVAVMTNRDDVILSEGEIDFFPEVFGDRATIYPNGGHMGNMEYAPVTAAIVEYFQ